MSRRPIKAGTTGCRLPLSVADSSSSVGAGLPGLVFNTANLVAEYRRDGQSSWTAITLVAGTLGTFTSGGWVADGSLAGDYELGVPNAALVAGVDRVWLRIYGAANMVPVRIEIPLTATDDQDATRMGLTALPNAAAAASGGLPTVDGSNRVAGVSGDVAGKVLGGGSGTITGTGAQATVGGYVSGQAPADSVLATPANKLATDSSGRVDLGLWKGTEPASLPFNGFIPAVTPDGLSLASGAEMSAVAMALNTIDTKAGTAAAQSTQANSRAGTILSNQNAHTATLAKILGLSQHNQVLRDQEYDGDGNLTAATLRAYATAADATADDGETGLVGAWAVTATYTAGRLTHYLQTAL